MKKQSITNILIYIVSAELVGALSALCSGGFGDFFQKYREPPLQPPGWVFAAMWGILYALMGYAAYRIHAADTDAFQKKRALTIYWVQLALNFSWSIVFFRMERMWAALAVILLMLVCILIMLRLFRRIDSIASGLNIPYLLWTMFAVYLNLATAILNRAVR